MIPSEFLQSLESLPDKMTATQAAKGAHCAHMNLLSMIHVGVLPATRIGVGHPWRVRRRDLIKWVEARRRPAWDGCPHA